MKKMVFIAIVQCLNPTSLLTHLYNSVAILVASLMFLQSINQNLADTVVVNDTQSFTNVNGVDPVTSSHWARDGPPIFFYK